METSTPERELQAGLDLLGAVDYKFVHISDVNEPLADGKADGCFISKGYDATTHFESTMEDALDLYYRITGEPVDLSAPPPGQQG